VPWATEQETLEIEESDRLSQVHLLSIASMVLTAAFVIIGCVRAFLLDSADDSFEDTF